MSKGVNLVILFGHLAKDPTAYETPNGTARTRFRIIVDDEYFGADKKRVQRTDGFWVTCYGSTASFMREHARKGHAVHVRAELREGRYQAANGETRYENDIIAVEVTLCSRKNRRDTTESSVPDAAPPPAPTAQPKNPF